MLSISENEAIEKKERLERQLNRIKQYAEKNPGEQLLMDIPKDIIFDALDVLEWMQEQIDDLSFQIYI